MLFLEVWWIVKERLLEFVWVNKKDINVLFVYWMMFKFEISLKNKVWFYKLVKIKKIELSEKIEFNDLIFKMKYI